MKIIIKLLQVYSLARSSCKVLRYPVQTLPTISHNIYVCLSNIPSGSDDESFTRYWSCCLLCNMMAFWTLLKSQMHLRLSLVLLLCSTPGSNLQPRTQVAWDTHRTQSVPQGTRPVLPEPVRGGRCVLTGALSQKEGPLILRFSTRTGSGLFPLSLMNAQMYVDFSGEVGIKSSSKQ